jgi:hypothetical protein
VSKEARIGYNSKTAEDVNNGWGSVIIREAM